MSRFNSFSARNWSPLHYQRPSNFFQVFLNANFSSSAVNSFHSNSFMRLFLLCSSLIQKALLLCLLLSADAVPVIFNIEFCWRYIWLICFYLRDFGKIWMRFENTFYFVDIALYTFHTFLLCMLLPIFAAWFLQWLLSYFFRVLVYIFGIVLFLLVHSFT